MQRTVIGFLLFCLAHLSYADEIRPGYLELKENSQNIFSVLWKVPAKGDKRLKLQAQLPVNCINNVPPHTQLINGAYIQRWVVICNGGLIEQTVSVAGLDTTHTDVLLRLEFIGGNSQSVLLNGPCFLLVCTLNSIQNLFDFRCADRGFAVGQEHDALRPRRLRKQLQ